MLQIPFKSFKFGFECFKSLSNGVKLHSNSSNLVRKVWICFQMLRILFEWLQFAFKRFESLFNGQNMHLNFWNLLKGLYLNASNLFRKVRIWIRMLKIPFYWFELAFECFESLSNSFNLYSNASNLFRTVRIYIQILRSFEGFEFGFECFESFSMARIWIGLLRISFKGFEFAFECFKFGLYG